MRRYVRAVLVQCANYESLLNLMARSELLCTLPHPAPLPDPAQAW